MGSAVALSLRGVAYGWGECAENNDPATFVYLRRVVRLLAIYDWVCAPWVLASGSGFAIWPYYIGVQVSGLVR